ncbi:hypothetical protein [Lihuaxuella thermophila]|uniref:Uncharacterized protein n=1 Tax=Lihuaxuella thermophila TaxID=1173111 RepID=A0A1H8FXT2_9BACL|nr:hypothetical protein [Lihuaxuella thermophila]SEN36354.1 hypothetical protein SAMN05444955_109127 [Lihuaxuella thermophila]
MKNKILEIFNSVILLTVLFLVLGIFLYLLDIGWVKELWHEGNWILMYLFLVIASIVGSFVPHKKIG